MAKRTISIKSKLTFSCARAVGIQPGKPWSDKQRKKVSDCVAKKLRSK
jgi:hypothetical protein